MTILEELQKSVDLKLTPDLNDLVVNKLVSLFQHICPFDISSDPADGFVFVGSFLENEFVYEFKYGEVRVTTYSNKLNVCVYFNGTRIPMVPVGVNFGYIEVDDMFNYKKATFQARFNFGNEIPHYPEITRSSFYVDKVFNRNLEMKTELIYTLHGFNSGGINFNKIKFPKAFFENNIAFQEPLMKMLEICSQKPDVFYDVFEEYPCHEAMIADPDEFQAFLRLFHTQYNKKKKVLKSKILLLDMQEI